MSKSASSGKRSRARLLLVQSLYQQQVAGHDKAELLSQFRDRPEYQRVDQDYFDAGLAAICDAREALETDIGRYTDRPVEQLDPVERAILLLGFYELESRPDVPFKAVINEAVNLAKRLGALDGHKYINAVLDKAAKSLRDAAAS
jgi:N utilization substance protein B